MKKEEGYELLKTVIEKEITHQDYDYVVEIADKYYKMKTGDKITDLLKRMITRETEDEFEQRTAISKSVIPSTLNSTMLPYQKALRKKPLIRELLYEGADKKTELEDKIANYWGEKSLEEYLEFAFIAYNYIDPNAFLITEFSDFNSNIEKASPYPFVATSEEAIMYEYKNEILQYLIVKLPIKFKDGDEERDGVKFTMYLGYDTIQFTQVSEDYYPEGQEEKININEKFYAVEFFEPKGDKVPAARFGFISDMQTRGRTYASVFHCVLLLLEKMMKTDSELDLTTALTAFPQRFAYVDRCSNPDCHGGKLLDGRTICTNCGGTGQQPLHSGVKDVITLTLPKDPQVNMIDLERLLVYKTPPIELLQFNDDYIATLRKLIHAMMFNAEIFSRNEITATATEKILETDNMNDTLYPFARAYSAMWEFIVRDIATFTDLSEGLTVLHKMPEDFKMKGINELMDELKKAKDARASTSTISAIEDDINAILYSDRPDEFNKIQVKQKYNPFRGYDEATVRLLVSQGKTTKYNETLWANLESIFNEIELEVPEIYVMADTVILEKVKGKTQEYIEQIEAEKPEVPENPFMR